MAVLIGVGMLAEELHSLGKGIRDRHAAAVAPEVGVVPRGRVIVKNDEVADSNDLAVRLIVEARP